MQRPIHQTNSTPMPTNPSPMPGPVRPAAVRRGQLAGAGQLGRRARAEAQVERRPRVVGQRRAGGRRECGVQGHLLRRGRARVGGRRQQAAAGGTDAVCVGGHVHTHPRSTLGSVLSRITAELLLPEPPHPAPPGRRRRHHPGRPLQLGPDGRRGRAQPPAAGGAAAL